MTNGLFSLAGQVALERSADASEHGAHPAVRWGTPADLVETVVFLASTASDYVNGHVLAVDGGWLAR